MTDHYPTPTDADAPTEDGVTPDRLPPHHLLAEQSVLGAMMLGVGDRDRDLIDEVAETLYPDDFYFPKHVEIARVIVALHRTGAPTDVIAVTDALEKVGKLRHAGGADYLHTLTGIVPTAANAGYWATIVAEKAVMRRLVDAGTRIQQMGYASEGDAIALVTRAEAEVDAVARRRKVTVRAVGETLTDMLTQLEQPATYLPTPWPSLDSLIGGFERGNLYVFAARPGGGKSIAVLQASTRLARRDGGAVAFYSLEMTTAELQQRLVAQFGGIQLGSLRSRTLTDLDWKLAADARVKLLDAPIYIDDTAGVTIADVRAHARAVARRHGSLAAVVVDYLQLLRGEGRDRQEIVSNNAEALKHLAKDLDVPVIAAAQLKRAGAERRGKRQPPGMDDLRESGGIENNADVIVLQHRPEDDRDAIELIVAKNRHGAQGRFTLRWQGQFARLMDPRQWAANPGLFDREEAR